MELRYGIARALAFGTLFVFMGLFLALIAIISDDLSQIRFFGILTIFFGQTGTALVMFVLSAIVIAGGVRAACLPFNGGRAATITTRGVEVRSIYYTALLKWSDIAAIQLRTPPLAGKACWLTFVPKSQFSPWVKLGSMSENVIIGTQLLANTDEEVERWVSEAMQRNAEPSRPIAQYSNQAAASSKGVTGNTARPGGFGRKRV